MQGVPFWQRKKDVDHLTDDEMGRWNKASNPYSQDFEASILFFRTTTARFAPWGVSAANTNGNVSLANENGKLCGGLEQSAGRAFRDSQNG